MLISRKESEMNRFDEQVLAWVMRGKGYQFGTLPSH